MKKPAILFTVFLLLAAPSILNAQEAFEGKVVYKLTSDDESMDFSYFVKEGNMKIDMKGESDASMIFSSKDNKMLILMPEEKMYMEMPSMMNFSKNGDQENDENSFTNTGEKKEINGYLCEKWIFKDDESEVESWLTKELGSFMFFSNPMEQKGDRPEWQSRLESEGYFPMLVIARDSHGDVETSMEVTSVEKMNLSDDMFSPPSDYQKMSVPGLN